MSDDLHPEVPNYPEGDDVLARLTWWRGHGERIRYFDPHGTCEEFDAVPVADLFDAADEIERLRDDNQRLVNELIKYVSERDLHDLLTRHGGSGSVYSTEIMVAPSQPLLELDRLRALITAWADAEAADGFHGEPECDCGAPLCVASSALRKAVDR